MPDPSQARALAQGGDESTLRLLDQIHSQYQEGAGDTDPVWAWWIDERELAWHLAMARRDLGQSSALDEFEHSVEATPPDQTRSQYLHRGFLLQAQVEAGSLRDAEATIASLVPLVAQVGSTRTAVLLRKTLNTLDAAHKRSGIHDSAQALRTELERAAP